MANSTSRMLRAAAALMFCAVAPLASPAAASDMSYGGEASGFQLQAGGIIAFAPKYEGSDEFKLTGFPIIAPVRSGGDSPIRFNGIDDLRLRVIEVDGFEAGPLIGWRFGRDQDDADLLRGLGDVDGGFVAGAYLSYAAGPITPFLSYHRQVSGDDTSGLARFGVEARREVGGLMTLTGTLGATYADDDYMTAYFSVTPQQSAASSAGLAAYDAGAGVKDVYLGLSSEIPLAEAWKLRLSGRYARLIGDAADSPIVASEDQFSGSLGLTYRFGVFQ